jgi:hypothetical protein
MPVSDSFLYGARSGIQKAIRRGQVGLAKLCFDTIWDDPKSQSWLKWRLAATVPEDAWGFIGEYAKFLETDGTFNRKRDWYKLVIRLTVFVKNKDSALGFTDNLDQGFPGDREARCMHAIKRAIHTLCEDNPDKLTKTRLVSLLQSIAPRPTILTPYEQKAFDLLQNRRFGGGLKADKWICLAVLVLLWCRGLDEQKVKESEANQKAVYAGVKINSPADLPWYVFDMHTRTGKLAGRVWMKNYNPKAWGEPTFYSMWFCCESAKLGSKVTARPLRAGEVPDFTTHKWWPHQDISGIRWNGATQFWNNTIAPEMKKLVAWVREKEAQ